MYNALVTATVGLCLHGLLFHSVSFFSDVNLTPRHPSWIGAWWLGFVVFGTISILVSVPLIFFPRHIKPTHRQRNTCDENVTKTKGESCNRSVNGN